MHMTGLILAAVTDLTLFFLRAVVRTSAHDNTTHLCGLAPVKVSLAAGMLQERLNNNAAMLFL